MSSLTFTIVAGPNGAGKSTFIQNNFLEYVNRGHFINVDDIAHIYRADEFPRLIACKKNNDLVIHPSDWNQLQDDINYFLHFKKTIE